MTLYQYDRVYNGRGIRYIIMAESEPRANELLREKLGSVFAFALLRPLSGSVIEIEINNNGGENGSN